MNTNLNKSWNDFIEENEQANEIILFGASSCADIFMNKLSVKFNVKYVVDNDQKKHGKELFGKHMVFSPEVLKREEESAILLITSTYYKEILMQLQEMDFHGQVYSFFHLRDKVTNKKELEELERNLDKVKEILSDKKSKEVIDSIYKKRATENKDYRDIYESGQYFKKEFFTFKEDEVFIDGGAYDGETVEEFIAFTKGKFKKIYSFEMDKDNFDKIKQDDFNENVHFYNYGLWDKKERYSYISSERGSEMAKDGKDFAECISLDELIEEKVSFIKMDIEGAELKALIGAEQIIKSHRPKLAICLYHKIEDLWKIPLLVHALVPEYKLFIRHHSEGEDETVLYATL